MLEQNLRWGQSLLVQRTFGLPPLREVYDQVHRAYPKEGTEERKFLDRYYTAKFLEGNHGARQKLAKTGVDVDELSLLALAGDYSSDRYFLGPLLEECHFITTFLDSPRSS